MDLKIIIIEGLKNMEAAQAKVDEVNEFMKIQKLVNPEEGNMNLLDQVLEDVANILDMTVPIEDIKYIRQCSFDFKGNRIMTAYIIDKEYDCIYDEKKYNKIKNYLNKKDENIQL